MSWIQKLRYYLIINEEYLLQENWEEYIYFILKNGITCCQLRFKTISDEKFISYALKFKKWCDELGILLIINDRYWIAKKIKADGVHIGQEDISYTDCRNALGSKAIIGLSASTKNEILDSQQKADYLGIGPIYHTESKADCDHIFEDYDAIPLIKIPYVLVGGLDDTRIPDLEKKYHPAGFAMIKFLLSDKANILKLKKVY